MTPDDILANSERLIADAKFLFANGRARSASTLTVAALEQLGYFVEVTARQKYSDPELYLGIFGDSRNAHAMRQDALAAHVYNHVLAGHTVQMVVEAFVRRTGCMDLERILRWILNGGVPLSFFDDQTRRLNESPEVQWAGLLLQMTRENKLKNLREFGLYANAKYHFSEAAIDQVIKMTEAVRKILLESRDDILEHTIGIPGLNCSEEILPAGKIQVGDGDYDMFQSLFHARSQSQSRDRSSR